MNNKYYLIYVQFNENEWSSFDTVDEVQKFIKKTAHDYYCGVSQQFIKDINSYATLIKGVEVDFKVDGSGNCVIGGDNE